MVRKGDPIKKLHGAGYKRNPIMARAKPKKHHAKMKKAKKKK
ncbi:MAG TPA: hypothetical protein VJ476_13255 [Rhizomicrobium sp.]|nr:hypothetical protein [Rhizomicrobium sp.]